MFGLSFIMSLCIVWLVVLIIMVLMGVGAVLTDKSYNLKLKGFVVVLGIVASVYCYDNRVTLLSSEELIVDATVGRVDLTEKEVTRGGNTTILPGGNGRMPYIIRNGTSTHIETDYIVELYVTYNGVISPMYFKDDASYQQYLSLQGREIEIIVEEKEYSNGKKLLEYVGLRGLKLPNVENRIDINDLNKVTD